MAVMSARFFSKTLGKSVELNAIVPESGRGPFPVLYLLHGGGDDSSAWQRYTRIEDHVRDLPMIVVMPDGFYGFYVDNVAGPAYARYMMDDVVGFVERTLPARTGRRARSVSGLSMGGYGALFLALTYPDRFASANSHSGCFGFWGRHLDHWEMTITPEYRAMLRRIHGPRPEGGAFDLFSLATRTRRRKATLPKICLDCGTADSLLATNRDFHQHLDDQRIPHEYAEFPGGHTWDYWDLSIRQALAFHGKALGIS